MMTHWFKRGVALLGLAGLLTAPALAAYPEYYGVNNTNADASPTPQQSRINNYLYQPEQINLLPTDRLVKVLRTDQKNLVNDYVTKTIPVKNATIREMRNVVRRMVALEGGRAEAIRNKETGENYIQVIAPDYMIPYLEDAVRGLDVKWLKEYWDGAADIYVKMQHREASLVDSIAANYAGTEGFSRLDSTNNALSRFDEVYRNEKYVEAVKMVDIPENEVELEVKVYEVQASNDLKIGVDYIAWQNGPGRNLWSFATQGYKDVQRARGYTSVYDPFVDARAYVPSDSKKKIADFDGRESYRSVDYLLTSSFVDFLQAKGNARVINEQKLLLVSSNPGTIAATTQVTAFVNNLNDLDTVTPGMQPSAIVRYNDNVLGETVFVDKNGNGKLDAGEKVIKGKSVAKDHDVLPGDEVPVGSAPSAVALPVPDYGRTLEYKSVGEVGMGMVLRPYVGLESMELEIAMGLGDENGIAPSGQPIINTRTVSTTVRLLDGQPFVFAGLTRKHDIKNTNKAPWLGSIPVLGYLFGGEQDTKRDNDIVIVITPKFHLATEVNLSTPPRVKTLDMMISNDCCPQQGAPTLRFGYDQWLLDKS
jgi:type II secretory pathway component GspD/PulD (secretin)